MNIAVYEKEKQNLEAMVKTIDEFEKPEDIKIHVDVFTSSQELMKKSRNAGYDLIYLDDDLPEENVIQIAKNIKNIKPNTMIIFMSNHIKNINIYFSVNTFQFLKKPFKESEFISELERAIEYYRNMKKTFIFPTTDSLVILKKDEILYIETSNNKYKLHTLKQTYCGSAKLIKDIEETLVEFDFFNIKQDIIINLNHVIGYTSSSVTMKNGDVLTLSDSKYKKLRKQLRKFLEKNK